MLLVYGFYLTKTRSNWLTEVLFTFLNFWFCFQVGWATRYTGLSRWPEFFWWERGDFHWDWLPDWVVVGLGWPNLAHLGGWLNLNKSHPLRLFGLTRNHQMPHPLGLDVKVESLHLEAWPFGIDKMYDTKRSRWFGRPLDHFWLAGSHPLRPDSQKSHPLGFASRFN